jgi:putative mycofactocin binding protein MftB
MIANKNLKYRLAPGAQVREEDFGLLFYTQQGPRLYFLSCGSVLNTAFFRGRYSLDEWVAGKGAGEGGLSDSVTQIQSTLNQLCQKGVIIGC